MVTQESSQSKLKSRSKTELEVTQTANENMKEPVPSSELKRKKQKLKILFLIFSSLVLDLLAFTIILPLFPSILDYYDKNEDKSGSFYSVLLRWVKKFQDYTGAPDEFLTVLFGGALGSLYCFLQFLTGPIVGSLSDIYGRKKMLLICLVGIVVSHATWALASSFSLFVLARVIGGLSKVNVNVMMSIISDVTEEKNRPAAMALIGLAFSVGFIFGPIAGATWFMKHVTASKSSWGDVPAFYALLLSTANVVLVALFLPETLPEEERAPGLAMTLSKAVDHLSPYRLLKFSAIKELRPAQRKILSKIGVIYVLYIFIYSGLEFTLTFLTHHTFGYTSMQQGKMFLVIGLIMAIIQSGAVRKLRADKALLSSQIALLVLPLSFLLLANAGRGDSAYFVTAHVSLWMGIVIYAITTAFSFTPLTSVVASCGPESSRGTRLGCLRSIGSLGRAVGPIFISAMYWCWGAPSTYLCGAIGLLVPAYLACKLENIDDRKRE